MRTNFTNGGAPGQAETRLPIVTRGDLRQILWRHLATVLLPVVLALLVGTFYLQHATPQYKSTARIYVELTGPRILEMDTSGVMSRWDSYLFTQAELLRATETLVTALKAPAVAQLRTFAGVSSPIRALRQGLEVEVGKRDDIINVSFTSPYPDEAAVLVNAVVEAYIAGQSRRKSSLSAEAVKILGSERSKREEELHNKRQTLIDFEIRNPDLVFGTGRDNNVVLRGLEYLHTALAQAQVATLDAQAFHDTCARMAGEPSQLRAYAEAQRTKDGYLAAPPPTADLRTDLRADLKRLERERADCLQRLKSNSPAITALDAEITQMQQQLLVLDQEFAAAQLTVADEQLRAAQERQAALETHFEQERRNAVALNGQLAQYALLASDYERTKKFCDLLDERIQVLGVDPQVGGANVEILEAAQPPTSVSRPRLRNVLGVALCLGLFAGVGMALHREWKDQRVHSIQEISDLLGLPILGVVPAMATPNQTPAIRGQKVRISPDSREAEAFRSLRRAIFHGAPNGTGRTILVTSAVQGEGASTVVGNLAITMAHAGQKVVVVDANFRRPGQHVVFGMEANGKGLSAVVAGQISLQEAIAGTRIENLSVLTSGPAVSNPAEMIDGAAFAAVLKQLAEDHDRVLVDSPSVGAVMDAQILAGLCDATVLVVRAKASSRRASVQAYNRLAGVDARILGVVVNDVRLRGDSYEYWRLYGQRREVPNGSFANEEWARDDTGA